MGEGARDARARHTDEAVDWLARPLLVRAATLLVTFVVVSVWAKVTGTVRTRQWLTLWDADWYARIAAFGYPREILVGPDGRLLVGHELAFFPLFPYAARALALLTGLRASVGCLVVALVASLALGPATYVAARGEGTSRRGARAAVALLAAVPMPVILALGYAESLFLLLGLLALIAAQRRRWGLMGALLLAASLTRPSGIVTAAGVVAYAVLHWRRRRRPGRELAAILAAGAMGAAGVPAFWAWVGWHTGRPDGWFVVQETGWATRFDGGRSTWEFVKRLSVVHDLPWIAALATGALLLLGAVLILLALARRDLRAYAVWLLLGLVSTVGASNFWYSRPRLLLVMAVAVVPLAVASGDKVATRRGTALLLGLAAAQLAFGAYMALDWPYAI